MLQKSTMITQKTRTKIQTHILSSLPHQKCTWECNIYSPPGYTPGNFHQRDQRVHRGADLQQNHTVLLKQDHFLSLPLLGRISSLGDNLTKWSVWSEVSMKVLYAPVWQEQFIASQVLACLKDWERTDSRSNNAEELLSAKAQILQSGAGEQPPPPTSPWWLRWNFVLRTLFAHALPVIKLNQRLPLPAKDRFPRKWEGSRGRIHAMHSSPTWTVCALGSTGGSLLVSPNEGFLKNDCSQFSFALLSKALCIHLIVSQNPSLLLFIQSPPASTALSKVLLNTQRLSGDHTSLLPYSITLTFITTIFHAKHQDFFHRGTSHTQGIKYFTSNASTHRPLLFSTHPPLWWCAEQCTRLSTKKKITWGSWNPDLQLRSSLKSNSNNSSKN